MNWILQKNGANFLDIEVQMWHFFTVMRKMLSKVKFLKTVKLIIFMKVYKDSM